MNSLDLALLRKGLPCFRDCNPLRHFNVYCHTLSSVIVSVLSARYTKRSFCLAESFAAIVGNCKYEMFLHASCTHTSIDSKAANSRKSEDKRVIDELIENTIGFSRLDNAMAAALELAKEDVCVEEASADGEPPQSKTNSVECSSLQSEEVVGTPEALVEDLPDPACETTSRLSVHQVTPGSFLLARQLEANWEQQSSGEGCRDACYCLP